MPRSYWPDNSPIEARVDGNTVHLTQPVEQATGIRKEIVVTLAPTGTSGHDRESPDEHLALDHRRGRLGDDHHECRRGGDPAAGAVQVARRGASAGTVGHALGRTPTSRIRAGRSARSSCDSTTIRRVMPPRKRSASPTIRAGPGISGPGTLFVKRVDWKDGATYPGWRCQRRDLHRGPVPRARDARLMTRVEPGASLTPRGALVPVQGRQGRPADDALARDARAAARDDQLGRGISRAGLQPAGTLRPPPASSE